MPILILTAKDSVQDKAQNFEAGADDYLTKPFSFAELQDMKAVEAESAAARREYLPTLSAVGYASNSPFRSSPQALQANYAVGGINLNIPIFNGGKMQADNEQAKAKAEVAKMREEAKWNELVCDIRVAYHGLRTAYKNVSVTNQLAENAREIA